MTGTAQQPQTQQQGRRYVVIAPGRDESKFMRRTLDSLAKQTVLPARVVIVDDGSSDESPKIIAEYVAKYPWMTVVTRPPRQKRSVGPGVIEAFYAGFETITLDEYDYLCKLDLDLDLPADYFEQLMKRMEADPRLGTCSGKPYYEDKATGEWISEGCGDDTSIGASKFYRVETFKQTGGFIRQVMWDGIDCHRCRMLGWKAVSWDDKEIRFLHLRPMGSSDKNILRGRMRHGYGQYFMGTGLLYMLASVVARLPKRPRVIGAVTTLWGYVRSAITRVPRYPDLEFRRFLRRYHWNVLRHGKKEAVRRLDETWSQRARNARTAG